MALPDNHETKSDTLVFAAESDSDMISEIQDPPKKHKLLIVDDEKEIHVMTRLVLSDFSFENATLEFLSAYSEQEAKELIQDHPDAACILLDVVMEKKDSGLEVVRFIREEQKNDKLRIILRTGQPGKAPENDIICNYDINDYKEKTELTSQKLFTTITTALRSYSHLVELEKKTAQIAEKNTQLKEEVARRIVAESNLTRYNRSLEKMIDDKSNRLKTALTSLEEKEREFQKASQMARIGDISSARLADLDQSGKMLSQNLDIMNSYRSDMTILLEKYETLHSIITTLSQSSDTVSNDAQSTMESIDQFKKDVHIDEILRNYPKIIKDSSNGISHISKTVNDIKRFIAVHEEPRKGMDINQMLKTVSQGLKSKFNPSIDLQLSFGTIPIATAAPLNLEKSFMEIIKNGFEAIESQGIVSVFTSFKDPYIEIHISDIGQGISQEDMKNIFDPYFSKNKPSAQGLGLCFAKSVITSHSGTIDVSSIKGEGTHVVIRLPVSSGLSRPPDSNSQ